MRTVDHIRHELNLHQKSLVEISREIGVSQHSLYSFANKRASPRADVFLKVCKFLGYELREAK